MRPRSGLIGRDSVLQGIGKMGRTLRHGREEKGKIIVSGGRGADLLDRVRGLLCYEGRTLRHGRAEKGKITVLGGRGIRAF